MSLYDIKKRLEILELFKKSTNAMKLISLSLHHQLKKIVPEYKEKFDNNKLILTNYFDINTIPEKALFIFIASDRGFCGDYVNNIFHQFERIYNINQDNAFYMIIGKALINKIQAANYKSDNIIEFLPFKIEKFTLLYQEVINLLIKKNIKVITAYYTQAISISNRLICDYSFNTDYNAYAIKKNFSTGHFDSKSIVESFIDYCFKSFIYHIFYQSFFAEQGARFIAMDTALTNTNDAIDKNKKLYFKLRQQKINNQLQDLVSSLL
jgi:F-type H+-transporting ATPase subunit gamma